MKKGTTCQIFIWLVFFIEVHSNFGAHPFSSSNQIWENNNSMNLCRVASSSPISYKLYMLTGNCKLEYSTDKTNFLECLFEAIYQHPSCYISLSNNKYANKQCLFITYYCISCYYGYSIPMSGNWKLHNN